MSSQTAAGEALSTQHVAVLAPRSNPAPTAIDPTLLEQLRSFYVDDVADAVGPLYTMDAGIRPMHNGPSHFAGQAITVKAVPGDNLAVFGALAEIRPGDVLIIDWRGHIGSSVNGASMLVAPRVDGLEAVVVDGGVRDVAEVASLGIPLFGRAVSASAPGKREIGEVNVPVSCGGVVVEPGDIVFGGGEGVVVIPRGDLERVLAVLTPYVAPATLADWPLEERRSRSLARVEQYRAALAEAVERTASPS